MAALQDALRPLLQPITHSLPIPIRDTGISLLGPECYKSLLLDIELLEHPACLKLAISKALGIGIVGASAVVKIPQLLKLLKSQSSEGISFLSYLLETSSFIISLAYNVRQGFPFSTYGETALIAIQNVAIAALVLQFAGKPAGAAIWIAGLAAGGYTLFDSNIVDMRALTVLMSGAGALSVASKAPQIYTVWMQGGTGQLSAFAVFNFLFGSLARIFTTLQEVPDPIILGGYIAGGILNAILAAQMVYYWDAPSTTKPATSAKKAGARKAGKPVATPRAASTGASTTRRTGPTTRRRG